MSVQNVGGHNGDSNKTLRKLESSKSRAERSGESRTSSKADAATPTRDETATTKTDAFSPSDVIEISSKGNKTPMSQVEIIESVQSVDSVEISWRDPEVVEKIRDLIEMIKSKKAEISQRIEAARILIMERAYDDNQALRDTAEAILRGENVDDDDLNL